MMMLSIIVINYKMEDLTISFVRDELCKVKTPHKVVIVNNAATPESNAVLSKALKAQVIADVEADVETGNDIFIISSPENLGFARGNNLGADFSKRHFNSEYILFSNNDIVFKDDNVVESLINKLETLPDAGVIGPMVIGLDGIEQSPWPYRSFWDREIWMYWSTFFYSKEKKIQRFQLDYPQKAAEGYHHYVMGSFFMVRANDFFECGMFDPKTFLYAEEEILSERMAAIGKKVYYLPAACVIHAHGSTTSKMSRNKASDLQFKSECYYYKTYRHTCFLTLLLGKITHVLIGFKRR